MKTAERSRNSSGRVQNEKETGSTTVFGLKVGKGNEPLLFLNLSTLKAQLEK